jgi:hypothetical protein
MALSKEELEKKLGEWKIIGTEIPVKLETQLQKSAEGVVYFKEWTAQEKTKRAGRTLAILWGLAILTIAVPIAHFVLVPGFLIAGPIAFLVIFNREDAILGGVGTCPDCQQTFDIAKSKVEWPLKDVCSHCYHHVTITKSEA